MIDILEIERNRYCDFFNQGIEQLKKDKTQYAVELLIETNAKDIEEPFNLLRLDFIYKDKENIDKINALQLDSYQDYKTIIKTINNTQIEILPFCWDNCNILTDKIDSNKLIPWFEKWIDIEDSRYTDYSNSIHNCSMIQKSDNINKIIVDFGTAPIESMLELIDLLTDDNDKITIK